MKVNSLYAKVNKFFFLACHEFIYKQEQFIQSAKHSHSIRFSYRMRSQICGMLFRNWVLDDGTRRIVTKSNKWRRHHTFKFFVDVLVTARPAAPHRKEPWIQLL